MRRSGVVFVILSVMGFSACGVEGPDPGPEVADEELEVAAWPSSAPPIGSSASASTPADVRHAGIAVSACTYCHANARPTGDR